MANCSRAPCGQYRISILTIDSLLIWKKWFIYLANDANIIIAFQKKHLLYFFLFGMSMCKVDKYWHIRMNMPGMSLWGRYQRMPWQKFTEKCSAPWAESVSSWWLKLLSKFWFIVCYFYREKILLSTKHWITGLPLKMTSSCDKNFWLFLLS